MEKNKIDQLNKYIKEKIINEYENKFKGFYSICITDNIK